MDIGAVSCRAASRSGSPRVGIGRVAVLASMAWLAWGCTPAVDDAPPSEAALVVEEEVELSGLMGTMQRHGAKLGYALEGRNRRLAAFYLEELTEVLEEVEAIEAHDGMPIGHPAGTILRPLLPPLDNALQAADWPLAWAAYEQLIDGCNRCHFATEHDYIAILPATGEPPFHQRFTPLGAAPAASSP